MPVMCPLKYSTYYWQKTAGTGNSFKGGVFVAAWSGIRHKLESEYLAESLRGHIQYFATTYSYSPDHEGRASIRLDGEEILRGNFYNQWFKVEQFPHDDKYELRIKFENPVMDDVAIDLGLFDQRSFYEAFREFDGQSIEKSLESDNLLVRIFALLDRRVGKRRLYRMAATMEQQPTVIQRFFEIRAKAEGMKEGAEHQF